MHYDVFNGDADGIFALHQLRLARPVPEAQLITGVKRDIGLLKKIPSDSSAAISVFDISLDKNREELTQLLDNGSRVLYIDHHFAGAIPSSGLLEYHIEPSAEQCTSLIVNELIGGIYPGWAVCGAFGDNLHEQAAALAAESGLTDNETECLREIGELFNYNGYGAQIKDLLFHPADLYRAVQPFSDPRDFFAETDLVLQLKDGYEKDMGRTANIPDISENTPNRIFMFPAASWARRIAGVFSNLKAREKKDGAHAVIVENDDHTLQISVRAPLVRKENADTLCRNFPTGGGRAAAAGINKLPADMLDEFIQAFNTIYS